MSEPQRTYDWNEQVEKPNENPTSLLDGEYQFLVVKFERGEYSGGPKIPACLKAIITCEIFSESVPSLQIKTTFLMHQAFDWKMCSFFKSIGLRKKDDPLVLSWDKAIGGRGMCRVENNKKTGYLEIKHFLDPETHPIPSVFGGDVPF